MRLKSLRTYGFKSFAEKTELNFNEGLTAIVGPNGSGKSNVADAVRWALGEQSAKYLRGGKMEDVIFAGSSKRRALNVAEVSLNFDNSLHRLPLDFEEVSITRRLFRSGESEYLLNGKSCRLKDVIDLFADTGLGRGSLSVIGQNRIDEILNSRAEDRRALFEEAAGIAKYRLRKKEALRRLEETGTNLVRISDIKGEVAAQVEPLRIAADKARRYDELSGELKVCSLTRLVRQLDRLEQQRLSLQTRKEKLEEELACLAADVAQKEASYADAQLKIQQTGELFDQLQQQISAQEKELEKINGKQQVLAERKINTEKNIARLTERNAKLNKQADELDGKMRELAAEYDKLEQVRTAAELNVKSLGAERATQRQQLAAAKARGEELEKAVFSGMQELLQMRNELRALEREQEQRMRRRDALKREIETSEMLLHQLEENISQLLQEQSLVEQNRKTLAEECAKLQQNDSALTQTVQKIHEQQRQLQQKLSAAEASEESLRRLQSSYEGFGYGVKTVMQAQAVWRQKIVGTAAELLSVPDQFVAAVETALGEGARSIVTVDADAAKEAIAYLKSVQGGRATFLPLDTVKARSASYEEQRLTQMEGIYGFAADLIGYDRQVAAAVKFLLGRVLVAQDLQAAYAAAKAAAFKVRVVTLEGDVVNAGGSMTGGSKKQMRGGYLSREKELKDFAEASKKMRAEMLSLQESMEETEERQAKVREKLRGSQERQRENSLRGSELALQLDRMQREKSAENEKLALLLEDKTTLGSQYLADREKIKKLRGTVLAQENKDAVSKQAIDALQKETAALGSELAATENLLQDAMVQLDTSAAKTQLMIERIRQLDGDAAVMRDECRGNAEEIGKMQIFIQECGQQTAALAERREKILRELQGIVAGKKNYGETRLKLLEKQGQMASSLENKRSELNAAKNKIQQLDLELARQNSSYGYLTNQLQEDYQLNLTEARKQTLSDCQEQELQKRESNLQLAIAELGAVNPNAVSEYNAAKERAEFLQRQYEDLLQAKDNLEAVISEINSGMTKKFQSAFSAINKYFAQCYSKLFGGGMARLKLSQPEDLLNSGVEIEAQPPGKKLQSLYLLSGGERALTVIALLFALLEYQPAPFVVLDEIDAALDDANIARFAAFVKAYAVQTQFIIITHRKGTMEAADVMYGITMEESGVSKLLSVKISAKE